MGHTAIFPRPADGHVIAQLRAITSSFCPSAHVVPCCVVTGPWSSPLDHMQPEDTQQATSFLRTYIPSFTTLGQHDATSRLSWNFSHVGGTCPDPRLLLRGNDKLSQRCSPSYPGCQARQMPRAVEVEYSRKYVCYDAPGVLEPRLADFDITGCSFFPKHPKTRWGKTSSLGCLLSTVKLRGK